MPIYLNIAMNQGKRERRKCEIPLELATWAVQSIFVRFLSVISMIFQGNGLGKIATKVEYLE
jgi:hypothetical protein